MGYGVSTLANPNSSRMHFPHLTHKVVEIEAHFVLGVFSVQLHQG